MLPLAGRRILVTRTREQSSSLAGALRAAGAHVLEVPTIQIEPPRSYAPLDEALARLAEFDGLLVTSANTARVLVARKPAPWEEQPWTVAVGPATAATLRTLGLRVDQQPLPSVAESVVRELAPEARGKRFLLPRSASGRDFLPDALRAAGATVETVDAYRTAPAEEGRAALAAVFSAGQAPVDAVVFTSSSTVENFFALLGPGPALEALRGTRACSIGPVTSATLHGFGVAPAIEALPHDVSGLGRAVLELLAR